MLDVKKIYFYGIDSWNRPCFKVLGEKSFFGDTDHLFDYGASENEVIEYYKDLLNINEYFCYFGTHFGCEPYGASPESMNIMLVWITQEEAKKLLNK